MSETVKIPVFYEGSLTQEGEDWLVCFPQLSGCQTYGKTREEAIEAGAEALELWLESARAYKVSATINGLLYLVNSNAKRLNRMMLSPKAAFRTEDGAMTLIWVKKTQEFTVSMYPDRTISWCWESDNGHKYSQDRVSDSSFSIPFRAAILEFSVWEEEQNT